MPGKPIVVGPFVGGLNNISTSGEAQDDELVQLVNFEVGRDTALASRPPIQTVAGSTLPATNTIGWDILGIYRINTTLWYLIVSVPTDGTTNENTTVKAYQNGIVGAGENVTIIKNSIGIANRVTSMVQFKDWVYFNVDADATDTGFRWKFGEAVDSGAIATMPRGSVMISWKSRLWVGGVTRLGTNTTQYDRVYFSTIDANGPQPQTWGTSDFFDVSPGEGGFATALLASFNNLIIFKSDGAWRFSFPSRPADGIVEKLSGQVGAASKHAVVEFENYIYVYDQGVVYELINSNFTQINRFVRFSESSFSVDGLAPGVELSIMNRRLIVRYYNSIFVYTVDTKTWSQWFSYNGTPGRFVELPTDSASAVPNNFIAASKGTQLSVSSNLIIDPNFKDAEINTARQASTNALVTYPVENNLTYMRVTKDTNGTVARVYLNRTGGSLEYDLPVSVGQKFQLSASILDVVGTGQVGFRLTYSLSDGTVSNVDNHISATGAFSVEHTAPANAVLAQLSVYIDSPTDGARITFNDLSFTRKSTTSPMSLLRLIDQYDFSPNIVEYIDCWMETKSYDYQAAPAFKRLFYWGIDIKTTEEIKAEARPVSKKLPVTWNMLEQYTHDELEQGTWENPLSFLNRSTTITDFTQAQEVLSENGRFFVKLQKSLRFRQVSFYIKLKTMGNEQTGPAKIFSITTMIVPKQDVVDKLT